MKVNVRAVRHDGTQEKHVRGFGGVEDLHAPALPSAKARPDMLPMMSLLFMSPKTRIDVREEGELASVQQHRSSAKMVTHTVTAQRQWCCSIDCRQKKTWG